MTTMIQRFFAPIAMALVLMALPTPTAAGAQVATAREPVFVELRVESLAELLAVHSDDAQQRDQRWALAIADAIEANPGRMLTLKLKGAPLDAGWLSTPDRELLMTTYGTRDSEAYVSRVEELLLASVNLAERAGAASVSVMDIPWKDRAGAIHYDQLAVELDALVAGRGFIANSDRSPMAVVQQPLSHALDAAQDRPVFFRINRSWLAIMDASTSDAWAGEVVAMGRTAIDDLPQGEKPAVVVDASGEGEPMVTSGSVLGSDGFSGAVPGGSVSTASTSAAGTGGASSSSGSGGGGSGSGGSAAGGSSGGGNGSGDGGSDGGGGGGLTGVDTGTGSNFGTTTPELAIPDDGGSDGGDGSAGESGGSSGGGASGTGEEGGGSTGGSTGGSAGGGGGGPHGGGGSGGNNTGGNDDDDEEGLIQYDENGLAIPKRLMHYVLVGWSGDINSPGVVSEQTCNPEDGWQIHVDHELSELVDVLGEGTFDWWGHWTAGVWAIPGWWNGPVFEAPEVAAEEFPELVDYTPLKTFAQAHGISLFGYTGFPKDHESDRWNGVFPEHSEAEHFDRWYGAFVEGGFAGLGHDYTSAMPEDTGTQLVNFPMLEERGIRPFIESIPRTYRPWLLGYSVVAEHRGWRVLTELETIYSEAEIRAAGGYTVHLITVPTFDFEPDHQELTSAEMRQWRYETALSLLNQGKTVAVDIHKLYQHGYDITQLVDAAQD